MERFMLNLLVAGALQTMNRVHGFTHRGTAVTFGEIAKCQAAREFLDAALCFKEVRGALI